MQRRRSPLERAPVRHEPETLLAITNARIARLLESPQVSDWLKAALLAADGHDPIGLHNEIEILRHVIAPLAQADCKTAMQPLRIARRGNDAG
ncbi:hypothetical protein [Polymorphobacter sp.]|uniref:hypothetical protein n=1 Tax=Polymorphobacter sp. TaxID=1909290 RepID=UPI003F6F3214